MHRSQLSNIKEKPFLNNKCIRADTWLQQHIDFLQGRINETDLEDDDVIFEDDNGNNRSQDLEVEERAVTEKSFEEIDEIFDEMKFEEIVFKKALLTDEKKNGHIKAKDEDIVEMKSSLEEADEFDGRMKWKAKNDDAKKEKKKIDARITIFIEF